MSKAEAFEAKFAGNRSINVEVNFSKGDAIKVPVNINSMDADVIAKKIADQLQLPEIDTTEFAKQGENQEATNSAIYESLKSSSGYIKMTNSEYDEFKAHIIEVTNNILN